MLNEIWNNNTLGWIGITILAAYLFWRWVLRPEMVKLAHDKRLQKRINVLTNLGFDIPDSMMKPYLPKDELELLNSYETPIDEHILLYYKMYCKKWDMKCQEMWTTEKPMSFEEWEKRAKTATEIHKGKGRFGFMVAGGYQYIIPMTCDTMIGLPPNQTYHRYHDYKSMVITEDEQFMEIIENETTTNAG